MRYDYSPLTPFRNQLSATFLSSIPLALATVVVLNTPALAQPKWEYDPYSRDAAVVANVEQQWVTALLKRDTATLQVLRADDFTLIAPDGKIYNTAAELALILSPLSLIHWNSSRPLICGILKSVMTRS